MSKTKEEKALISLEIQATNLVGELASLQEGDPRIKLVEEELKTIDTAQAALRKVIADSTPLSVKELRSMLGKPVFEKDLGWFILWNLDKNFVYLDRGFHIKEYPINDIVLYRAEKKGCGKKL